MAINDYKQYSLDEYMEKREEDNALNLELKISDFTEDSPITTDMLQNEIKEAGISSNYDKMIAIAGNLNKIDTNEETAKNRFDNALKSLNNVSWLMDKDELADAKADAEDEAEGETNIIFKILDTLAKPMYAMEGAAVGLFARNDDNYDDLTWWERTLEGIEDGWTGAKDEEGNRIVTDASVVASIINGDHDVSDWNIFTRLAVGLPTMFFFGKYDPLMKAFHLLGNSNHSIKGALQTMREKGIAPKILQSDIYNTDIEDSIVTLMNNEQTLIDKSFKGTIAKWAERWGVKGGTEIKSLETGGTSNLNTYESELRKLNQDIVNNVSVQEPAVQAALKNVSNFVNDSMVKALNEGDMDMLRDTGAFQIINDFHAGEFTESEIINIIKHEYMSPDSEGYQAFRQALTQETMKRLHTSLLGEGGYRLRMLDVLKTIYFGDGKATTLTRSQLDELKAMMIRTGFIDFEQGGKLHSYILNNKNAIINSLDEVESLKNEIKLLKSSGSESLVQAIKNAGNAEIESIGDVKKLITTATKDGINVDVPKWISEYINTTGQEIDVKKLSQWRDISIKDIVNRASENDSKLESLTKKLEKMNNKETTGKAAKDALNNYNIILDMIEGRHIVSENVMKLDELEATLKDASEQLELNKAKVKKVEKAVAKNEDEIESFKSNIVGAQGGKAFSDGNRIYKRYVQNLNERSYYKRVLSPEHINRFTEESLEHSLNSWLNIENKVLNPKDAFNSVGSLLDAPKEQVAEILEDLQTSNPDVYKYLKDKKVISKNNTTKGRITTDEYETIKAKVGADGDYSRLSPAENTKLRSAEKVIKDFNVITAKVEKFLRYEQGHTLESATEQMKKIEDALKNDKKLLSKIFTKYESELNALGEESTEIRDWIKKLKSANKAQANYARQLQEAKKAVTLRESNHANILEEIEELKTVIKDEQPMAEIPEGYAKEVLQSGYGARKLAPILDRVLNVNRTSSMVNTTDSLMDDLALYTMQANLEDDLGKEWFKDLHSMFKGDIAKNINENLDFNDMPMVNQRLINGLNEYIKIGTEGKQFTSSKMKDLSNHLRTLQAQIYDKIIKTTFSNIEDGDIIAAEIMEKMVGKSNNFFDVVMDEVASYQKKVLNNKSSMGSTISDKLTGNTSNNIRRFSGAQNESSFMGSVEDINRIVGETVADRVGTSYDKYDITQQLFLDNPLVAIHEQLQDSKAFGEFGAVLTHAFQNGVVYKGSQAPAELVRRGRLKEIKVDDLKSSLLEMLKYDSESYYEAEKAKRISMTEKLKEIGIDGQSTESIEEEIAKLSAASNSRAGEYLENLINRNIGDVLNSSEQSVFVPNELHRFLDKKLTPKDPSGLLQFYDKMMNWWKTVTLFSPGFNAKNFFGNFAAQYIVDPGNMSYEGFSAGKYLYNNLNEFNEGISKVATEGLLEMESLGKRATGKDVRDYIRNNLRENPERLGHLLNDTVRQRGIKSSLDLFDLYEEAEKSRVMDNDWIQSLIGSGNVKGNVAVALQPTTYSQFMKAQGEMMELSSIDPASATILSGNEYDVDNYKNGLKKLIDRNLALSHDMTSAHKVNQLMGNKLRELEWFNDWAKAEKHGVKVGSISELNDLLESNASLAKAWRPKLKENYRKFLGYEDGASMIQNMFFDPGALSGMESTYASRLIPFWGFFKKSLELSISRINKLDFSGFYGIERMLRHFADIQGISKADMSEFARNEQYLPIKIGGDKILNFKWGNPTQTLNSLLVRDKNMLAELFGNSNPILKFAVSEVANREDLFFGGKYDSLQDEMWSTMAPGALRNATRQIKYQQSKDELDSTHQKSILAELLPSIFKDEVITDNHVDAYNAAALKLEKELNKLQYDGGYQIKMETLFPELPEYQDFIFDLF